MYRNCVYLQRERKIELFTWGKDGNRVRKSFPWNPYLYVETNQDEYDAKSIFGNKLKKKVFDTNYERNKFVKESGINRIYYNLPPVQQFLIDVFWKYNKREDFSKFPLKVFYLDIEVYSPDEFPDEEFANHPINLLTIYDNLADRYMIWGLAKDYVPTGEINVKNYTYVKCANEKDLLINYINYLKQDYPDIITAWNLPFDNKYIVNRIRKLFGEAKINELSPVNRVYRRTRKVKKQGREEYIEDYVILGISLLDYLEVYDKFNFNPVPNLKLDTIAEIELGINKIDYEQENLASLSDEAWDKFVDYNIRDVEILKGLEEKLNFLKVARMLSYMGLTLFENGVITVPLVNGYTSVNAYEKGMIVPTYTGNKEWYKYEGGRVKEPVPGCYKNVISYDLNSLYPNIMITLNASPETKFGKIVEENSEYTVIKDVNNKEYKIPTDKFKDWIKQEKMALSKAGVLFSQKKKGIFSEMVEEVYNGRVLDRKKIKENKKLLEKLDKEKNKEQIVELEDNNDKLDIMQHSKKIYINSCYGYLGCQYSPMSDIDIARSITITGQQVIINSEKIINKLLNTYLKTKDVNYVIYCDTDSAYLTLKDSAENCVGDKILNIVNRLEKDLNSSILRWGEIELHSISPRFEFKREAIADKGLFLKKKMYVYHAINYEGFSCDKWVYKGVKLVKAEMPKALKPLVKKVVQDLIMTENESTANIEYMKLYDIFNDLDLDDICKIQGITNLRKYLAECKDFETAKGMPFHCKGSYFYNLILDKNNLANKYTKIKGGDKVKLLYLKPNNKYRIPNIAYLNKYPEEFLEMFQVDRQLMFEKGVMDVLKPFYDALNFTIRKPNMQLANNVFELFS